MCIQSGYTANTPSMQQSEDCLYLNIFAPAGNYTANGPVPVMIWIYGGSFIDGAGSAAPFSGGDRFVAVGKTLLVTFNYRLGVLGWMTHDALVAEAGTTGNYGT